jgi:poly(3-hydroxybutyrate) depolymerase
MRPLLLWFGTPAPLPSRDQRERLSSTAAIFVLLLTAGVASAEVQDKAKTIGKTVVHYKVVLPTQYDPNKAYPAVLAFGGGPQTMDVVEGTIRRNWREQAEQRGYLVIAPAAPGGDLFFEQGARIFPEFLTKILADYKILENKFHVAGMSNGGLSAFHIAASYPQYFWSVTGFPGYLADATPARVEALRKMCINMFVGDRDSGWPEAIEQQFGAFKKAGFKVTFAVEKGQPHRIETLAGPGAARLFNQFDEARQGCK